MRAAPSLRWLPCLCWLFAAGCGGSDDSDGGIDCVAACADDAPGASLDGCACDGVHPRLSLETDGDFYALPFPHALRVTSAGTADLEGFPMAAGADFLRDNLPLLAEDTGFSTTGAILLSFDGAIDPESLPADAAASLSDDASVLLVNVDPASADYGLRTPVECDYRQEASDYHPAHFLSCLPVPGFPLRPDTTHALLLTDALSAADGTPVLASAAFAALHGAEPEPEVEVDAALLDAFAPVERYLAELEPGLGAVIGGTVFRTHDPIATLRAIGDAARTADPPPLVGELSVSGERAAPAEQPGYSVFEGRYRAPIYQQGSSPYASEGGEIVLDDDGAPQAAQELSLRFVLSVPDGEVPAAGFPIALYHHGTGGDAGSFVRNGVAHHLAQVGVSVIGIDAPVHGERLGTGADPALLFFNTENVRAMRDNVRQGAADLLYLQRFVEGIELPGSATPDGRALRFDRARTFFMGHSQGGLTGPLFLAVTEGVAGAMLSGAGGSIIMSIIHKGSPFPLRQIAGALLDLPAGELLTRFHPALVPIQAFTDPADTTNYAPYLLRWEGGAPLHLWATQGLLDREVPPPITDALVTALGLQPMAPLSRPVPGLSLRGVEPANAPASANLRAHDGADYTALYTQYPDADHFVVFQDPAVEAQLRSFFGSMVEDGVPTLPAR